MSSATRLFSLMLLAMPVSHMSGVQAHELRPSVADISRSGQVVQIELSTNLEALISEMGGGEHDDSTETPQAEQYRQLRALAPDALETELRQYLSTLLSGISLDDATVSVAESRLPLSLETVSIPQVGDTGQARDSVLLLQAAVAGDINAVTWQWEAHYGSIILRAQAVMNQASRDTDVTSIGLDIVSSPKTSTNSKADNTADSGSAPSAFTQYLPPGKRSDPMGLALVSSAGRGGVAYLVIGLSALLGIGAIALYRRRKRG